MEDESVENPSTSLARKLLRRLLTLASIVGILILAINITIDNPWFHKIIFDVVNETIRDDYEIEVAFETLSVTAVPPQVEFFGLKVTDIGSQKELLTASQLSAKFASFDLLFGEIAITKVFANELQLAYNHDITATEPAADPSEDHTPWPPQFVLPVEVVELHNSTINYQTTNRDYPSSEKRIQLSNCNLTLTYQDWGNFTVAIDTKKANIEFLHSHLFQNGSIEGTLAMKGSTLSTSELHLASHDITGKLTGDVNFETFEIKYRHLKAKRLKGSFIDNVVVNADLQLKYSNLTALGRFLEIADTSGPLDGKMSLAVKIPFRESVDPKWKIKGQGQVTNGKFAGFGLADARVTYEVDQDGVRFDRVEIWRHGAYQGLVIGDLKFSRDLEFDFWVNLEGMPFKGLMTALKVADFNLLDGRLYSEKTRVWGTGKPFKLKTQGQLFVKGLITPGLSYSHDAFPTPPDCLFDLHLSSDSQGLNYGETPLFCVKGDQNPHPKLPLSKASLLAKGKAFSSFTLTGDNFYDAEKGMNLAINSSELNLGMAEYYSQVPLSGVASANLQISGPYADLRLNGKLTGENVNIAGFPLGKTDAVFKSQIKENIIHFPSISASPEEGGTLVISQMSLKLDQHKTTKMVVAAIDLKPSFFAGGIKQINPEFPFQFGAKSLNASFSGPIQFPLFYQGDVSFDLYDGGLTDETFFNNVTGKLQFGAKDVLGKDIKYRLGSMNALLDLTYQKSNQTIPKSHEGSFITKLGGIMKDELSLEGRTLKRTGLAKDDLGKIPFVGKTFAQAGITGLNRLNFTLKGSLDNIQGVFDYRIDRLSLFGNNVSPLRAKGIIKGSSININEISQGGDSLLGKIEMDLGKEGMPYNWYFRFKRYDIRSFASKFFFEDPRNYAYLTGSWRMEGHFKDWWRSKGTIEIDDIRAKMIRDQSSGWKTIQVASPEAVKIKLDGQGWHIIDDKTFKVQGDDIDLAIATKGNQLPQNIGIFMSGHINASILKHFIPKVEAAKGVIEIDGAITGSTTNPNIDIKLIDKSVEPLDTGTWSPVSLAFTPFPPVIDNIRFNTHITKDKIIVEDLSAVKGTNGKIKASGDIVTNPESDFAGALNIALDKVEVVRLPIAIFRFDAETSGNLILTGKSPPYNLSGTLNLDKANSYGNFDIRNQIVANINKRKMHLNLLRQSPNLNLDLNVTAQNTIKIRNRNITATMSCDLNIKGTETQPIVLGEVTISEGKFFYKRDFKIRRGTLLFTAATYPPDPKLDLIADVSVNQYLIQLNISGYASDPKVEMTVDPSTHPNGTPINKIEILLLLTQGTLPQSDQPAQAATFGKIAQREAANVAVGQFEQPIEKLFDISGQNILRQVTFDFILDQNSALVPRINLPMHFTDEVNLILQIDNNSNFRLSSEYAVHDSIAFNWSLDKSNDAEGVDQTINTNTTNSSDTDSGVDLKFRFNFP